MCQYCYVLLEMWAVVCNLHVNVMDTAVHIFMLWYIYIYILLLLSFYRLHLLIFYQILLNVGGMHLYWMFCFAMDWAFGSVFRYVNALKWGSTSGLASGKSCKFGNEFPCEFCFIASSYFTTLFSCGAHPSCPNLIIHNFHEYHSPASNVISS